MLMLAIKHRHDDHSRLGSSGNLFCDVVAKIVQNKIPHAASSMAITATVAPPCGRGGIDTLAYSMYCDWQVYKTVFFSNIRHLSM